MEAVLMNVDDTALSYLAIRAHGNGSTGALTHHHHLRGPLDRGVAVCSAFRPSKCPRFITYLTRVFVLHDYGIDPACVYSTSSAFISPGVARGFVPGVLQPVLRSHESHAA